jgi:DNA adenine methylase
MTRAQSNNGAEDTYGNEWLFEVNIQCRPFVKWVGGKTQLLGEILRRMPSRKSIKTYHEPFIGGGAVFFALQPVKAVLSDANPELINAYEIVRDSVGALIRDLKKHEHSEEYFYEIRDADRSANFKRWSPVRRASRLIFLNKTCYNGLFRVNSKGHFNTPFGRYTNPNWVDAVNLTACSKALSKSEIILSPFDNVLKRARAGDFVYFDPPYAPVSETAYFTGYSKNGFGLDMQKDLFEVCCALDAKKVRFMLSNSAVPFIKELYSKFKVDIVHASRAVNSRAEKRGKVEEVLVTNY